MSISTPGFKYSGIVDDGIKMEKEEPMELTEDKALEITEELWTWLAETGTSCKADWPGWSKYEDYGTMDAGCPLCEQADIQWRANGRPGISTCIYCPYYKDMGVKCFEPEEPFNMWDEQSEDDEERMHYAELFLLQIKSIIAARTPAIPATPKFWMVIKELGMGSGSTNMRHRSKEIALDEAERLTKQHNFTFIVLEATEACHPSAAPTTWEHIGGTHD